MCREKGGDSSLTQGPELGLHCVEPSDDELERLSALVKRSIVQMEIPQENRAETKNKPLELPVVAFSLSLNRVIVARMTMITDMTTIMGYV